MDLTGLGTFEQTRAARSTSKGTQSRQRILDAAARILGQEGRVEVTIPKIAARAGISKGSVYYYFSDIDAIVREVVLVELDTLVASFDRAAAKARSARDALELITDAFIGMLGQSAALVRYLLGQVHFVGNGDEGGVDDAVVRDRVLHLIATQLDRGKAEGSVRADVDSRVASAAILGVFLAVAAYCITAGEGEFPEDRLRASILSFVGNGVSPVAALTEP